MSSAIVQRYLNHVLEAALSQNAQIQSVAIDVLTFTIKQGLAHPLQSFPIIVALETSPVNSISNRASALHAILQGKHSSLLNSRYSVSARTSFDYQKKIVTGPVQGALRRFSSFFTLKVNIWLIRLPHATYPYCASSEVVFSYTRKANDSPRLLEILGEDLPGERVT